MCAMDCLGRYAVCCLMLAPVGCGADVISAPPDTPLQVHTATGLTGTHAVGTATRSRDGVSWLIEVDGNNSCPRIPNIPMIGHVALYIDTPGELSEGSCAVTSSEDDCNVTIYSLESGSNGGFVNVSRTLSRGELIIDSIRGTTLSARVLASDDASMAAGAFTVEICE